MTAVLGLDDDAAGARRLLPLPVGGAVRRTLTDMRVLSVATADDVAALSG